jgi:hypothetical protein
MHTCTRLKQECNNKRKHVNVMFDNLWGYYHANSTSKRNNVCLSYERHIYIALKKRNRVQSLYYYYYYYYYGVQYLSDETSETGEHSSMFGSYILGCLNCVSILGYLRTNYLFKLTCFIPISNFIQPHMQQIFSRLMCCLMGWIVYGCCNWVHRILYQKITRHICQYVLWAKCTYFAYWDNQRREGNIRWACEMDTVFFGKQKWRDHLEDLKLNCFRLGNWGNFYEHENWSSGSCTNRSFLSSWGGVRFVWRTFHQGPGFIKKTTDPFLLSLANWPLWRTRGIYFRKED